LWLFLYKTINNMSSHRPAISQILLLSSYCLFLNFLFVHTSAYPYLSLHTKQDRKCMKVDFPGDATLHFEYEVFARDSEYSTVELHREMRKRVAERKKHGKKKSHKDKNDKDDKHFLQMPIILEVEPIENVAPRGSYQANSKLRPNEEKHTLAHPTGVIEYENKYSGKVHICLIQHMSHNKEGALVSLRIKEIIKDHHEGLDRIMNKFKKTEKVDTNGVETEEVMKQIKEQGAAATTHLSRVEVLLHKMTKQTKLLLSVADEYQKDEASFHQKTLEMESASRWWPILHVLVLLVTGFTQANHVVNFFKSRHII